MVTISMILRNESNNTHVIYLYKEGIFYKAYERSAYAFVRDCAKFQVKKKFFKCVNQEVVSVGFPIEGALKHFNKENIKETEAGIEVLLTDEITSTDFDIWKKNVSSVPIESSVSPEHCVVIRKIREFPIEVKTPLECMLFLSELKKEL